MEFTVQQAQAQLPELLAHIARGEEVVITDGDEKKPVAKVVACPQARPSRLGWEIATKHRLGKLPGVGDLLDNFESKLEQRGFTILPITSQQARVAGSFPGKHGDPFDRILAAQAFTESMTLLNNDRKLDLFGALRIW